jgi:hypothetical protein
MVYIGPSLRQKNIVVIVGNEMGKPLADYAAWSMNMDGVLRYPYQWQLIRDAS